MAYAISTHDNSKNIAKADENAMETMQDIINGIILGEKKRFLSFAGMAYK